MNSAVASIGLRALPIIACVSMLSSACGSSAPAPSVPPTKPKSPAVAYSEVWSGDPGVDLFSRTAELIRATMEAGDLALHVGAEQSYPGYVSAASELTHKYESMSEPDMAEYRYVEVRPDTRDEMVPSTKYRHIAALSATGQTVSATVCGYDVWPQSMPNEDDRHQGGGVRIELRNTTSDPGLPGIANKNPNSHDPRASIPPAWNVFGTWKVTQITRSLSAAEYPAECLPWYEQQFPTFTKAPKYNYLIAPQGYVASHHPVVQQFPEWIAPTAQ